MTRKSTSVTIRDVARQAGVSVATVSRYLNSSAPVSGDVAERLQQIMLQLRYVPHAAARHLASHRTYVIGLLLTNIHNDFFAPLLSGIEVAIRERGYNLLVATHHGESLNRVPSPVGQHNTDGLLVFADSLTDEDLLALSVNEFPLVLIHRSSPPSLGIPSVTVENKAATDNLINHLIHQHGKSRILYLRGPIRQDDSYWRETGYRTALEANGIPFDPQLILPGEFERDIAYRVLVEFLNDSQHIPFDAVFTGDDDAAVGALIALQQHGLRVPEDIAVVGFDDSRLSAFLTPPLTTVRAPTESVGRLAAERLFEVIEKKQPAQDVTLLPTELIIRRSCGCTSSAAI